MITDEKDLLAALAVANARRRSSVITLLVVNGLLVLGLAIFFLAPELRCEPDLGPPAPVPVDPRDLPFAPTTELALVPDPGKIIGINFKDRGFYIAPRPDGTGWYYFNLTPPWRSRPTTAIGCCSASRTCPRPRSPMFTRRPRSPRRSPSKARTTSTSISAT
ncbi:MAG: hypothetical protein IPO88_22745 [Nannocystis sp.]|uniref:hypothetical protein n=1 Tax=Nannocystis sp. TaxID=1962667 RepID=UPI0024237DB7|nr:hypothetical protein [Nannocystis sp.]MBK9756261.1 hypothetical protein [Nannocystis sp.]